MQGRKILNTRLPVPEQIPDLTPEKKACRPLNKFRRRPHGVDSFQLLLGQCVKPFFGLSLVAGNAENTQVAGRCIGAPCRVERKDPEPERKAARRMMCFRTGG